MRPTGQKFERVFSPSKQFSHKEIINCSVAIFGLKSTGDPIERRAAIDA